MLDSIFIGMSGLIGYSKGLRVISNNLTNVNTPGFKASQLQFADLFYQENALGGQSSGSAKSQLGNGLNTLSTVINFQPGELRQTGNPLDLAINGDGFFVVRDNGKVHYTRAGQFQFDKDGFLISQTSGFRIAARDNSGQLTDISIATLQNSLPKVTSKITMAGNLSSNASTDVTLNDVKVIDPAGGEHLVKLVFKNNSATTPGAWTVTISDAAGTISTATMQFTNGKPTAGTNTIALSYAPSNMTAFPVTLDFSGNVTSINAGDTSTLAVESQDGYIGGTMTKASFDVDGTLIVNYSNGQTGKGPRLGIARFDSNQNLQQVGGNMFDAADGQIAHLGYANSGDFGAISSGTIEGSNVDLAQEFSNLIVMQRGYQASSHVVSTANDMIQELFDMKGHR